MRESARETKEKGEDLKEEKRRRKEEGEFIFSPSYTHIYIYKKLSSLASLPLCRHYCHHHYYRHCYHYLRCHSHCPSFVIVTKESCCHRRMSADYFDEFEILTLLASFRGALFFSSSLLQWWTRVINPMRWSSVKSKRRRLPNGSSPMPLLARSNMYSEMSNHFLVMT